ncbi:hypothetical protein ACFLSZ_05060 [Candidatus Bipolaricaulota bacterium]
MKKTFLLYAVIALMVAPIAGLADTGGSATATLTLEAVINTIVDGTMWTEVTLTQEEIGDLIVGAGGGGLTDPIDWGTGTPYELSVTVQALTNWKVWASYSADKGSAYFTDADAFLFIKDSGLGPGALQYEAITSPESWDGTSPVTGSLTDTGFSGGNNLALGGETEYYNVLWDPTQIADGIAGDTIDLTIYFVVEDTTL